MLKVILSKIKYFLSKESCYTEMERIGIASMGCCCGVVGGTHQQIIYQKVAVIVSILL